MMRVTVGPVGNHHIAPMVLAVLSIDENTDEVMVVAGESGGEVEVGILWRDKKACIASLESWLLTLKDGSP